MILTGFIFLAAGVLTCLVLFLGNLDLFAKIADNGFAGYVQIFFDPKNLSTGKVLFMIGAVAAVLGLVLYLVGRGKSKKSGEATPVIPVKVTKFVRDTKAEFGKIQWPSFSTVVRNTGVTLAMCAVTAVVIIVVDTLLGQLVALLLGL